MRISPSLSFSACPALRLLVGCWLLGAFLAAPTAAFGAVPEANEMAATPTTAMEKAPGGMFSSPFANVSWPEIKMPKVEFRSPWADKSASGDGWLASRWGNAKTATKEAFGKTRSAWSGAIDQMKGALPGGASRGTFQVADAGTPAPGFFERWFAGSDPLDQSTPEDVVEMMANEPPPTRR